MNREENYLSAGVRGGAVVTKTMKEKYHKKVIQVLALKNELQKITAERDILREQLNRICEQIDKWSKSR